ncbi:DUF1963 domain-containing protein [Streptomyces sp. NRRL S-813]|uniref:DUF1963 domain-containing protein n=1 Tax=Streptomyces sp. NRRL S-813 TaxID=1463919 RepID=UPI0004C1EFF7|nr:DUF1963 domain-containing protein [Streptomyces sp. NRRL S-813]
MLDELREKLRPFCVKAVEEGIPAEEVDRWIGQARPCAVLTSGGDGPVAGRFGGPLLLPAGVPDPAYPYVASVDLAALPEDSTDLPLPPAGRLLLFASPWYISDTANHGQAVYVPAGTPVEERDRNAWHDHDIEGGAEAHAFRSLPQCELRVRTEPDLPYYYLPDWSSKTLPGFPHAYELTEVWGSARDRRPFQGHQLQIGGYPDQEDSEVDPLNDLASRAVQQAEQGYWGGGEPVSGAVEDWVLLAHWGPLLHYPEGTDVQWGIQRADLAACRFDRTFTTVYGNP